MNKAVVAIPGFFHHCNLAVFPASSKQDSQVFLFGTSAIAPTESNQKVEVEYLENHIYALLPSYQPQIGTVSYHRECPAFIQDFSLGIDLGVIASPAESYPENKIQIKKHLR